jgi:hypothetical protein
MAAKSGRFTRAELDGWLASLDTAAAQCDYLLSINHYIVLAAKEPSKATNGANWQR